MSENALLSQRNVMVAGGTGNVGQHIVRALLGFGATVVVPSRSEERLERLRTLLGERGANRLVTLIGDVGSETEAPRVKEEILRRLVGLDGVVASLGHLIPAPLVLAASVSDLQQVLNGYLTAHFVVARTFLPALREGGSYLFVNGPLAFQPLFPGTGLVSVATAAQAMLAQVVMKEVSPQPVRINEVVLYTSFGWGDKARVRGPVSQEDVGEFAAYLSSEKGSGIRGQTVHLNTREPLERLVLGA